MEPSKLLRGRQVKRGEHGRVDNKYRGNVLGEGEGGEGCAGSLSITTQMLGM